MHSTGVYRGRFLEEFFKGVWKMAKIIEWLQSEKVAGVIAIIAAVVMYFTPDHIDKIIELCLTALGIKKLALVNNEKKENE